MQEDKTSKWFAADLRKQQEENPLPYELGAWEAFEKKRTSSGKRTSAYWLSGIAASLVLLFVAGGIWLSGDTDLEGGNSLSDQITLEEKAVTSDLQAEEPAIENEEHREQGVSPVLGSSEKGGSKNRGSDPTSNSDNPSSPRINSTNPSISDAKSPGNEMKLSEGIAVIKQANAEAISPKTEGKESQIAANEKEVKATLDNSQTKETPSPLTELPKEPLLNDAEITEILETKSSTRLAIGLSPGYGASQGREQITSGSILGLGVLVDKDLIGKLEMGSGLVLNYLNQATESQSYAQIAGYASPVTGKNEIVQMQLDIPLYFKYPITRNRSISIQAGFSNLMTFNQSAEQQSSYTRQVAVLDANAVGLNSFTLKSESVNQLSVLEVPQNRFYPFATANLGVNIRLFESKKTSYELMPFYNYPLQEFSGYGEKLGMFGASFKVNFGTIQKK